MSELEMNEPAKQNARRRAGAFIASTGLRRRLAALCGLLLLACLPSAAQTTWTVTLFTDTNSTDANGNPGLGSGYIDPNSGAYDLRFALGQAIAAGGLQIIQFSNPGGSCVAVTNPCTIQLTNPLPPIESGADVVTESGYGYTIGTSAPNSITTAPPALTLTINGGEFGQVLIDGANQYRVFFIDSGNLTLANLQIQNGMGQGGTGVDGGGGGLGAGGGLFVNKATATVNVQNVYFFNCQVAGGNALQTYSATGGGGGMGFAGGNSQSSGLYAGGGGGILSAGGLNGAGGNGGGGGGEGSIDSSYDLFYTLGSPGAAYGSNSPGSIGEDLNQLQITAGNGGFGGGGGSGTNRAGNGGFGGGGGFGGFQEGINSQGGAGGFGGGGGGGLISGAPGGFYGGNSDPSGVGYDAGGGAALGPAIFVNEGVLNTFNSGATNDSNHIAAVAGVPAATANGATAGTAIQTPVFSYQGTVNGVGPANYLGGGVDGALPAGIPASSFIVTVSPSSLTSGVAGTYTVFGFDITEHPTSVYNGTLKLTTTSTGGPVTLNLGAPSITNGWTSGSILATLGTADTADVTLTATDSTWSYITGSNDVPVNPSALTITISSPGTTVVQGKTMQFTAIETNSIGNATNITSTATWISTTPSVATVSASGLVTAVSDGAAVIYATQGGVVSNFITLAIGSPTAVSLSAVNGGGQSAYVGNPFASELSVLVLDRNGIPLPGIQVTFAAPASGASAIFSNGQLTMTVATGTSGIAYVTARANATGGAYSVSANAGSLHTSFSLTNVPMPLFTITTLADDATGIASNCTNQAAGGATLDAACSLRDAIAAATAISNAVELPTINFSTTALGISAANPGTYFVASNGALEISRNMSIVGPGPNLLSISGGGAVQIINETSGTAATISGVTITEGLPSAGFGGGIYNNGTLTLSNCAVSANSGSSISAGGGIYNLGTLTVSNCSFTNNSAVEFGGAIFSTGPLTVTGSTFSNNSAQYGAGIADGGSPLTVFSSTFTNNSASSGGGAILNSSTATVTNSTFSGNTSSVASGQGGAILNSTFFNTAALTVNNSIFSGNTAYQGGGVYNETTANAADNVFYNNLGNGIEDDCNSCTTNTGAVSGDPMLAPLANNGGPTQTMISLPGSSAICAASAALIPGGVTADQRGEPNQNTTYPGYSALTPCVDAGAVQTNYAIEFSAQPPSSTPVGVGLNPEPVVSLTESGALFSASAGTVTMTDTASLLTGILSEPITSGAASFGNLEIPSPTYGDTLNATLALTNSINLTARATTAIDAGHQQATLTPSSGTLTSSQMFNWNNAVGPVDFVLLLGTTGQGSTDLYNSEVTKATSATVSIPSDGLTVYGTLRQLIGDTWQVTRYTFTEPGAPTPAALTPSSGTLSTSQLFTWNNGAGPVDFVLLLGTTGQGSTDLYNSEVTTATSATISIPSDGFTVYGTLRQLIGGTWQVTRYTFTEPGSPTPATLTPSTGMLSTSQIFTWNNGAGAVDYVLLLGTTGQGSSDIYNSEVTSATSATVSIPSDGLTVYGTLRQLIGGIWQVGRYTFTEPGSPTPATLTPSTGMLSTSQTFTWNNGAGPVDYVLLLGTTGQGSSDLYNSEVTTATTATVSIPSNGATVYGTLRQLINGTWQVNRYTFTGPTTPAN
jgi:predicted outer membrane repeat protein